MPARVGSRSSSPRGFVYSTNECPFECPCDHLHSARRHFQATNLALPAAECQIRIENVGVEHGGFEPPTPLPAREGAHLVGAAPVCSPRCQLHTISAQNARLCQRFPGLVVKLVVIKIGPSAGLPRPRVVQEERRRQFEHGDHLPAAHCGKSWRKSSMCCPACRCSISERAGTRVPPNTGAPPRICGERSIRSG